MEWLRISTSTELVHVATDKIVYLCADGNYSDHVLNNGKVVSHAISRFNILFHYPQKKWKDIIWLVFKNK